MTSGHVASKKFKFLDFVSSSTALETPCALKITSESSGISSISSTKIAPLSLKSATTTLL